MRRWVIAFACFILAAVLAPYLLMHLNDPPYGVITIIVGLFLGAVASYNALFESHLANIAYLEYWEVHKDATRRNDPA